MALTKLYTRQRGKDILSSKWRAADYFYICVYAREDTGTGTVVHSYEGNYVLLRFMKWRAAHYLFLYISIPGKVLVLLFIYMYGVLFC